MKVVVIVVHRKNPWRCNTVVFTNRDEAQKYWDYITPKEDVVDWYEAVLCDDAQQAKEEK